MLNRSILAALTALAVLVASPGIARAEPDEGGSATLKEKLEAATRGYVDAQAALDNAERRQAELAAELAALEPRLAELTADAQTIANNAYRVGGGLTTASTLLSSNSPGTFVEKVRTLNLLARHDNQQLHELSQLRGRLTVAKAALDAEVVKQQHQLARLAKQRQEVEKALASVGGGPGTAAADSPGTTTKGAPRPAPRRADGSWPPGSCNRDDPTTKGCLTPRTLHALQQSQAAGFTRFVSCWRPPGEPYEHPKGRACDFSAQAQGFGGAATGGDKAYGTELAAWLVRNASALGVLYVIWYKQIWTPSSGWRAYRSGRGDPSSDHTNHVHLSVT